RQLDVSNQGQTPVPAKGRVLASLKPVSRWLGKEFLQGDALPTHQQLAPGLELQGKGCHAGERFAATSAFDLNCNHRFALLQNKIHFMVAFTPVGDADVRAKTGIEQ